MSYNDLVKRPIRAADVILVLSLVLIFAFLILAWLPQSSLVLLLAPIALCVVLYEFSGGTILALVAMIGVALLVALNPDHYRRAVSLIEVWPFLVAYLAAGPFVGCLWPAKRRASANWRSQLAAYDWSRSSSG